MYFQMLITFLTFMIEKPNRHHFVATNLLFSTISARFQTDKYYLPNNCPNFGSIFAKQLSQILESVLKKSATGVKKKCDRPALTVALFFNVRVM